MYTSIWTGEVCRGYKKDTMHHSLRFYSKYREIFLRYYIFQAKWTRIPLIGNVVRAVAEAYGRNSHGAYLLKMEEANQLIDLSRKVLRGPCSCRKVFKNCNNPVNVEIIIGMGTNVFTEERRADYKEISKQEARDIILDCHERHLIHTVVRCGEDFYAICNCCPCCCVPMRLKQNYRIGKALERMDNIVEAFKRSPALQSQDSGDC